VVDTVAMIAAAVWAIQASVTSDATVGGPLSAAEITSPTVRVSPRITVAWVRHADESTWASDLSYYVDIIAVLDPDTTRVLRCGSRALHVRPDQLVQL